jgi:anti-anti-sigma factor
MMFRSEVVEAGGVHTVTLSGHLDSATSGDFEKSLQGRFQTVGGRVLVDFSKLDYISSAGLRVVLMAAKRAKTNQGHLVLFGLQPHVREIFEISGFLRILEIVPDRETALASLAA